MIDIPRKQSQGHLLGTMVAGMHQRLPRNGVTSASTSRFVAIGETAARHQRDVRAGPGIETAPRAVPARRLISRIIVATLTPAPIQTAGCVTGGNVPIATLLRARTRMVIRNHHRVTVTIVPPAGAAEVEGVAVSSLLVGRHPFPEEANHRGNHREEEMIIQSIPSNRLLYPNCGRLGRTMVLKGIEMIRRANQKRNAFYMYVIFCYTIMG